MTETQTLAQLKRKYDAEMVSALLGAGFTKNAYGKALNWTELLMDLVVSVHFSALPFEKYDSPLPKSNFKANGNKESNSTGIRPVGRG